MLERILNKSEIARLKDENEQLRNQITGLKMLLDLKESELESLKEKMRGDCQ